MFNRTRRESWRQRDLVPNLIGHEPAKDTKERTETLLSCVVKVHRGATEHPDPDHDDAIECNVQNIKKGRVVMVFLEVFH